MKTILLADDSITIQKVVELTFSEGDYRVLCVSNGSQALRKIAEARPDVVLLDVIMPEKNGYEVCEAMKADPATAGIPVLLLTGTFEPFDAQRAEAAGAEGHLTKPFESHTLVARVEEMIASAGTRATAPPVLRGQPVVDDTLPLSSGGPGAPGLSAAAAFPARSAAPMPAPEPAPPAGPHPAFAAPEAAAGGSYMGFADLAIEDEVIPDRYDVMASPATVRVSREEADAAASPGTSDAPDLEGFVPAYDLPPAELRARAPRESREPETPHVKPFPRPEAAPEDAARVTASPGSPDLSDEALERLAEMIVRRMSDRVVREIAWEVIPGVAEAIVRQRIREIEGEGR